MSPIRPIPNALDVAYAGVLTAASPLLAWNLLRTGRWPSDWRARLGHVPPLPASTAPTVLIHGVSVGEVTATEPLVRHLSDPTDAQEIRVVLSATTDTGHARATALFGERHPVVRYPLDFSRAVDRFLDRVRPDVVALMELEVWPNFVRACHDRGIPVVVVNGRLSAKSLPTYRRFRSLFSPSFRRLSAVAVQTERYAERFAEMGVSEDRIRVADSLKWDVDLPHGVRDAAARLRRELGVDPERPLAVAFSSGPGEEARLLERRPAGIQLMVVPRKPERFGEVAALAPWVRRSDPDAGEPTDGLFLIDTMGEADAAIAAADVALVGRSWNGMGGSNPVPAARLGVPLVCGPDHQNFTEMVSALGAGGALRVAQDPWTTVEAILSDVELRESIATAGPRVVATRSGAGERNVALIREVLRAGNSGEGR